MLNKLKKEVKALNKLSVFKSCIVICGTYAAGKVVYNVIECTTPIGIRPYERVALKVGSFIIGSVITEVCSDKLDKQVTAILGMADIIKESKKMSSLGSTFTNYSKF